MTCRLPRLRSLEHGRISVRFRWFPRGVVEVFYGVLLGLAPRHRAGGQVPSDGVPSGHSMHVKVGEADGDFGGCSCMANFW